jgi:lathosterol oxidase
MILSSLIFYYSYVKINYSKWLKKSNPKYPSVENVRMEIILMLKGICSGTFCPSLTIYLMSKNELKGYCGIDQYGWIYLLFSFFNPTPFAVIAEDYIDQIVGASPLILIPMIIPINMDLLFFQVCFFFIII